MSCPGVFVQDPERYLKALKVTPRSLFQPRRRAILDSSLRERVNFEIYYFADKAEKERFRKDPLKYSGIVTDPITVVRFRPTASSPRTVFGGRTYFFAADSTLAAFLKDPVSHQDRRSGSG